MSKSEFAQAYTERMFPDIAAPAGYIDPEFEVLFDNFAFDEVITEEGRNVPAKDRFLAILATLVGASAVDEYALMLPAALNFGLIPDEVVELIYQAVPYLGIGRVRPFFKVTNKIFDYRGEAIVDPSRSTITGESRLEKGVENKWKSLASLCVILTKKGQKIFVISTNGLPICSAITIRVKALA